MIIILTKKMGTYLGAAPNYQANRFTTFLC